MPESFISAPEVRCSALEEFIRKSVVLESNKTQCHGRSRTPIRINGMHLEARKDQADMQLFPASNDNGRNPNTRGERTNPLQSITANDEPPAQPPSRKPGSSTYYGVRYRPDLNKWVAEIRVAEWKAVDKKVWLGTFDTEKGAARGVDLARKLLKCKKKHHYNLPCSKLDSYLGQIPPHLILTDVTTNSMFKAATLFIKRECQEYAASFDDSPNTPKYSNSDLTATTTNTLNTPDHHSSHFQQTPGTASMLIDIVSQTTAIDAEILDELANDYSDSESCIMLECNELESISINDYLNDCNSFDPMAVSQSGSPSSYTSTTSCMTFDQQCLDVAECEMNSAAPIAGFSDDRFVMSTGMIQSETQSVQEPMPGAVSQECWAVQYTWSGSGSSSTLAPLPGLNYSEMASSMSNVDGGCNLHMDCNDLSFQGVYYPFQYGSNEWY